MPIINEEKWASWVENNKDPYGGACVAVARKAMEILDLEPGDFDTHELISRADKESGAGGITGYMAGAAASMISVCHSRGEEFRAKWNKSYNVDESQSKGGVVNPAIITIDTGESTK